MVGSWTAALLLGLAASSAAKAPEKPHRALKRRAPGIDIVTNNVIPLKPVNSVRRHHTGLRRRQSSGNSTGGLTAINNPSQANYVAQVGWGNETFSMILDTGSSDTWILQEGFQCLDSTGAPTTVSVFQPLSPCQVVLIRHRKATAKLVLSSRETSLGVRLRM